MLPDRIEWKGISLQGLTDKTVPLLYEWRNSSSFLSNLTSRHKISLDAFQVGLKADFNRDRHSQFIIWSSQKPVGTIYSYSYNPTDKYCFVSVFTDKELGYFGIGAKSTLMFCRCLFSNLNLYKIYFDVYEYNHSVISLLRKRGVAIEGQFLKQHLYNDNRYDVFRFAIYDTDIKNWWTQFANSTDDHEK